MDTLGWILLLIVAACIVALIVISRKRRELEKRISSEFDSDGSLNSEKPVADNAPQEDGSPQMTIYEYRSSSSKCICPICDGENELTAKCCRICGQKFSKKGVM